MKLYKLTQVYNRKTGQPCGFERHDDGRYLCDYTGHLIDPEDDEMTPLYTISIDYNNDCEELWYEDKERRILEKEYGVEYGHYGHFLSSPYHFAHTEGYGAADMSLVLIDDWMKLRKLKSKNDVILDEDSLGNCDTIEQAFRASRLNTVMRLLKDKTYTPQQLGLME